MTRTRGTGATTRRSFNPLPIAAALVVAGLAMPAQAISFTWFDGDGDWGNGANWRPTVPSGPPGSTDIAIINAGTASLSFAAFVAGFNMGGGQLSGAGILSVSGSSVLTGGDQTGPGTTQFNGSLAVSGNGSRSLSSGRTMITAGTTTWGGNTSNGGNAFNFVSGATIVNSGTWNDTNNFNTSLGNSSFPGTNVFTNSGTGTYNKTGNNISTLYTALNNSGIVNVTGGRLSFLGDATAGGVSTGTFHIGSGATLAFGSNGSSDGLSTLSNATFSGTGTLLVDASSNFDNTDVRIAGNTSHAGTFAIANGTVQVDNTFAVGMFNQTGGQLLRGTTTVSGAATFTGGDQTGPGTTQFNGSLALSGNGSRSLSSGRTMITAGTTTWGGNTSNGGNAFNFVNGATIVNSGTWNDTNNFNTTLGNSTFPGTNVFNNSGTGTYNKTGNSISILYTALNNSGIVNVTGGRLSFLGDGTAGGVSTGTFHIGSGATLAFGSNGSSDGLSTLSNATFSGTGTLLVDASSNFDNTDVRIVGNTSHAGTFAVANGTVQVDNTFAVGMFNQTGGQLLRGTTTVSGAATFTGGDQTGPGTTEFNGSLAVSGNGSRSLSSGRTMITAGTTTWGGNTSNGGNAFNFVSGATIVNSGTWNDTNNFNTSLGNSSFPGTNVFTNSGTGTYNKTGNNISTLYTALNNSGIVNVTGGRLSFLGDATAGGVSTGTFHIGSGATLAFGSNGSSDGLSTLSNATFSGTGTLLVDASSNFDNTDVRIAGNTSHAGTFAIANGTVQVDNTFAVGMFNQTGGQLLRGTTTVSGAATFTGGDQTGPGTTQFNGSLALSGNGSRSLSSGRTMITAGTTTWGGNTSNGGNAFNFVSGATIVNSGTWNDTNNFNTSLGNSSFPGTNVFTNSGTYNKTGNSITTVVASLSNIGSITVQSGVLLITGPFSNQAFLTAAAGKFQSTNASFTNSNLGTLRGNGTIQTALNQALTNQGVISPGESIGRLTIDGSLIAGSTATLNIELANLASFDQLAVTKNVTLGGALSIWNLGYAPALGDSFIVMTFDQRQGASTFQTLNWYGFGADTQFAVSYHDHDVTLTVTAAVPEPHTWLLLVTGIGVLGSLTRRRSQH